MMRTAVFYLTQDEVKRLDEVRGYIPRSRLGALAVQRLLDDVESGRLELLPKTKTAMTATTTEGEKENE